MRAAFIDVDGIRTRYLYEGSGPPLFLLHGVGVSGDTFCRNIDVLSAHFAVCAPDMLGHGFTDSVDYRGGPPQPHIVRHLGRLADLLGFRTYSVAGSSFGGLIASLMYFDRPEQVDRLIVIGSGSVWRWTRKPNIGGTPRARGKLMRAAPPPSRPPPATYEIVPASPSPAPEITS